MSFFSKKTGDFGEKTAIDFLLKKGFKIIDKNFRSRLGEIDLVATKNKKLHFIEVKTRIGLGKGHPYEAVNPYKIKKIEKLLELYLKDRRIKGARLSLDVVSIVLSGDKKIENISFYESVTS